MFIRNAWYTVGLESDLDAGLVARTIMNEPLVMFRGANGEPAALLDRCPHRQVPLSQGCLHEGQVQCAYHGMRFDHQGRCTHIPSQVAIPQRAQARAYPLLARHGLLFAWMGDPERADPASIPDHSVTTAADHVGEMFYMHAKTDYRLGIDNFLDPSHVTFVHPNTVTSPALTKAVPEILRNGDEVRARRVMREEKSPPMLERAMGLTHIDRVQDAIFMPVGNTRIDTRAHAPGRPDGMSMRLSTLGLFTPETDTTCHVWAGLYRDFALDNAQLSAMVRAELKQTMVEDISICEKAQSAWDPSHSVLHLAVDQASLMAREILETLQRREQQLQA